MNHELVMFFASEFHILDWKDERGMAIRYLPHGSGLTACIWLIPGTAS